MIATISISAGRRRWRSPQTATVKSPSARCRPASTSKTPVYRSASTGTARTREIKSLATAAPNCSTTAPSQSSSPTEMATKPYSKANTTLLQQPASKTSFLCNRGDRRLGLQFDDPKVKACAQVLLPAHEPASTRFVGSYRIPYRIPVVKVGRLPLDRVIYLFGRRAHGREDAPG